MALAFRCGRPSPLLIVLVFCFVFVCVFFPGPAPLSPDDTRPLALPSRRPTGPRPIFKGHAPSLIKGVVPLWQIAAEPPPGHSPTGRRIGVAHALPDSRTCLGRTARASHPRAPRLPRAGPVCVPCAPGASDLAAVALPRVPQRALWPRPKSAPAVETPGPISDSRDGANAGLKIPEPKPLFD